MSGAERKRSSRLWGGIGLVLLIAGVIVWIPYLGGADADRAWRAVLINFLYFTPLTAGLVTWSAVVRAADGKWMGPLETWALLGNGFAIPSLLALLSLWAGSSAWAPWYGKSLHQGFWLNNNFLFARDLGALLLFWILAWLYQRQRVRGEGKALAGWLVLTYTLVFSLLGFDLGMALDPHWASSLFGGYFFITGMYMAVAAWTLMVLVSREKDLDRIHDLGKLIFAFAILSTYMMYSQLLPMYYENLPHETRFVIPRLSLPWKGVSIFLLATAYMGPLVLLLTIWAKRNRLYLGAISALILVSLWIERWWLVAPHFSPWPRYGLVEAAATAAFLGLLVISFGLIRRISPAASLREEES